jgi:hypothetical protein
VEQKVAFKSLLRQKKHHLITNEIRRELFQSASRDERDKIMSNYDDDNNDGDEEDVRREQDNKMDQSD